MKTQLNLYISIDVVKKLKEEAEKKGFVTSYYVEKMLRNELFGSDYKYSMMECNKCNAKYSSKINFCPSCAEKEIKQSNLKIEKDTIDHAISRKKKVVEDLQMLQDPNFKPETHIELEEKISELKRELKNLDDIINIESGDKE